MYGRVDGDALNVAPYMGAWIEMSAIFESMVVLTVAPYMGAWIEIVMTSS